VKHATYAACSARSLFIGVYKTFARVATNMFPSPTIITGEMLECVEMKVRFILLVVVTVVFALRAMGQETVTAEGTKIQLNVTGTVTDVHGDAIAGARVRCVRHENAMEAVTDRSGAFVLAGCMAIANFDGVPEKIVIIADGFERATVLVTETKTIVLHASSVSAMVSVSGVETTLSDSPASVTVVDRRTLSTSGALTLDDRLRRVPGFTLFRRSGSRTANPTTQGVSLRGVGASGASRAIVLRDGVPLNDPFGSWVYWGRVPAESIAEVEIVRGAASDLYGTAAVGGVVSVRTREIDDRVAAFDLAYGNEQTPFGSMYASDKWHVWGGSIAGEYFKTDGYIPTAPEQRGAVDTLANSRRTSVAPFVERSIGDSRVFFGGEFYREKRANGTPLQHNDTRIDNFSAGADVSLRSAGELTLRSFGGTEDYHQSFSAIATNRETESLNRLQTVPSQNFGASARWTRDFRSTTIFAGGEYRNIRGRSDETGISNGRATVATSAGGRESSGGVYVGVLIRALRRLTLNAGARYDRWNETHGLSASRNLTSNVLTLTNFADRDESAFSPRGSALFRLNDHISLTGSVARGFRQPTLNELYRSFRVGNVLTLSNANLRPERATSGEAAVVVNAFDERLYLRAGPYCTRLSETVSNVTLTVTPALITRQRQNLATTRSCGFEADASVRATRELTFNGGYLHVDAKVREGDAALVGLRLPQIPTDQATLEARYSRLKLGTASIQLRTASAQFDDDQNQFRLREFIAFDAFVSHNISPSASIYAAGENIFDTRIQAGLTPVLTLAQPRTIRFGIRLRFGRGE
jgi:outer membrane receptor protein involved in Fe transport